MWIVFRMNSFSLNTHTYTHSDSNYSDYYSVKTCQKHSNNTVTCLVIKTVQLIRLFLFDSSFLFILISKNQIQHQLNSNSIFYVCLSSNLETQWTVIFSINAKLTKFLSQIKHNKSLFIFKAHCVTTELNNDNNEMKNVFISSNISQLVDFMLLFFWNLILFSSQNVKVFSHNS